MKADRNRLADATLPIMPETGRALRELLDTDTTRNPQLQPVLLNDPAAATAVFRRLEKVRPGAFERVADPAHAVSLMGQDAFRSLIESLPIASIETQRTPRTIGRENAYSQAAHAAVLAADLCNATRTEVSGDILTAALLQQPAMMALWATDPVSAKRATNAVQDGVPIEIALGAELGEPPATINTFLAERWAFPSLARDSLGTADGINNRPKLVRLADRLAQASMVGWGGGPLDDVAEPLAEFLRLDADKATAWLHRSIADAAQSLHHVGYPLPAFNLAMLPGECPLDEADALDFFERRKNKARKTEQAAPGNDLQSTLAAVMRKIRQDAGAGRVMFAMLNRDRSRLRTRLALGGDPADGLRKLDLDLGEKTLFSMLMAKPQSVWLNRSNAKKLLPYLPTALRKLLGPSGAYMVSLFVNNRPLGLLYGDGDNLSEQGFKQFCALANEATAALTSGSRTVDKGAA
ncbi:HDOD domain-containing protein [Thiosocius teredinicola]|uniref:HDOD domain-containing protein n=1 Tax=Thiosocius teredinicola TaxID=1973002 RepID=UPI000990B611